MAEPKKKPNPKSSSKNGRLSKPPFRQRLRRNLWTLMGMTLGFFVFIGLGWIPSFEIPGITTTRAAFDTEPEFVERLNLPDGFRINLYAVGLGRVRGMTLTPTGDLLVTSPGRRLLRVKADGDGDGRTDGVKTLLDDLGSPHGLLLDGPWLYVAETGRIVRMRYDTVQGRIVGGRESMAEGIPPGGAHWTRTIKKGPNGWFYVSIGSACNVCREGHPWRAAMIRFRQGREPELFASGLRNTVGFDWHPASGRLYGVDNGRDWMGDDFPPEELNEIRKGGFYGWPYFHGDNAADPSYGNRGQMLAAHTLKPVHKLTAHSAPLAILFLRHLKAPGFENAALVTRHGSWNRSSKSGYDIVSLHWSGEGKITQRPFLTGFETDGDVTGRPVDVIEAKDGTIYVSDDLSGVVWRITHDASQ